MDDTYAFHVYVGTTSATRRRLDIPPTAAVSAPQGGAAANAAGANGVRAQSVSPAADRSVALGGAGQPGGDGSWALVSAAAAECGMLGYSEARARTLLANHELSDPRFETLVAMLTSERTNMGQRPIVPWSEKGSFYVFPRAPTTCDEVLEDEETLLCMADKLAEASDGIAPIYWHNATFLPSSEDKLLTLDDGWVIPPQADKDKFIARDLAINILGHITRLDATRFPNPASGAGSDSNAPFETCSEVYSRVANLSPGDASFGKVSTLAFGVADPDHDMASVRYPGRVRQAAVDSNVATLVNHRLKFETNVLRQAGHLLHDLIRTSVYTDLSASELAAARGAKRFEAPRRASLYEPMPHAARVLFGRWELGGISPDPMCAGAAADGLIGGGYAKFALGRALDDRIRTRLAATAGSLFERTGIILQTEQPAPLIREALSSRLINLEAAKIGVPSPLFGASFQGTAIRSMIAGISDQDLNAGRARSAATVSLLTEASTLAANDADANQSDGLLTSPTRFGLKLVNERLASEVQIGAVVLAGGVNRAQLTTDAMARGAYLDTLSQCNEFGGPDVIASVDASSDGFGGDLTVPNGGERWMLQDAFSIGQGLRNRLVKLRANADGIVGNGNVDRKGPAAGVAELGAWAGSGRIVLTIPADYDEGSGANTASELRVDLFGIEPSAYGFADAADLAKHAKLVFGEARDAECAAGLRADCVADATTTTAAPTSWSLASGDSDEVVAQRNGATTKPLRLVYDYRMAGSTLRKPFVGQSAPPSIALYVVLDASASRAGPGIVLGAVAPRGPANSRELDAWRRQSDVTATSFTVSPMMRELANAVLGLGKWVGERPGAIGDASLDSTSAYCVEGVPRDVFVPLENELTSDSDNYENSWRHYLALAKEAATNADALGQRWVELGTQKDLRAEAAQEEVRTRTGAGFNPDQITFDAQGHVIAGPNDTGLATVLANAKVDLVFLTTDPFAGDLGTETKESLLRNTILNCKTSENPLCVKLAGGAKLRMVEGPGYELPTEPNIITYALLGLAANAQSPAPGMGQCRTVVEGARSLKGLSPVLDTNDKLSPPPALLGPSLGGAAFRADIFATGLQEPWAEDGGSGMANFARNMKLAVDEKGDWSLTTFGDPVMDSHIGSARWPGCLRAGSTTPCDLRKDEARRALNDLFRRCPVDQYLSPLGACESNGDERAELNAILWRVEAALWTLDSMTGEIPQGTFDVPTPAVDFNSRAWDGVGAATWPLTVYGSGAFVADVSDAKKFVLASSTLGLNFNDGPGEGYALSPGPRAVSAIAPEFTARGASGNAELPAWLRSIYAFPDRYRHVWGQNVAGVNHFGGLSAFMHAAANTDLSHPEYIDNGALRRIASGFTGSVCAAPEGVIRGSDDRSMRLRPGDLQGVVAAIKTSQRGDSPMRANFWSGDQDRWGLWMSAFTWKDGAWTQYYRGDMSSEATPRAGWFNAPPATFQWYDKGLSSTDRYTTDVWKPTTTNAPQSWGINYPFIDQRKPSVIPPSQRVFGAVNSRAPADDCAAAWQFTQAIALGCVAGIGSSDNVDLSSPPEVKSVEDLRRLTQYIDTVSKQARVQISRVALPNMPLTVVKNIKSKRLDPGSATGEYGKVIFDMMTAAQDLPTLWSNIVAQLEQMKLDIEAARIAIDLANNSKDTEIQKLAMSRAQTIGMMAKALIDAVFSTFPSISDASGHTATALKGAVDIGVGIAELVSIGKLDGLSEDRYFIELRAAMNVLQKAMIERQNLINGDLGGIRKAMSGLGGMSLALEGQSATASYYAAKAAGAGYSEGPNGEQNYFPVNTVLNRQISATELRYKRALRDAKALAYLARRAIEQRLGTPLADMTSRIGPLDAPATWADDVCRLSGVDYRRLRFQLEGADQTDQAKQDSDQKLLSEFADGFVGDYVGKLERLVEYYNVQYPSHDGDDTAIVSVRDDMLGRSASCVAPSRNLLLQSGHFETLIAASSETTPAGWQAHRCPQGDTHCLAAFTGTALVAPNDPPLGLTTSATWLVDRPRNASGPATPANPDLSNQGAIDAPAGLLSQQVALAPGDYALSWWDQARDAKGALATGAAPYRAGVYAANWSPLQVATRAPFVATVTGAHWGERRVLRFTVADAGVYHVAFGASLDGAAPGSVAIANAQLEAIAPSAPPSQYEATSATRNVTELACLTHSPDELRARFERRCSSPTECYYELTQPLVIDTRTVGDEGSPLAGKVAAGNFNYRHIDVALNLVGTGVRDCASTPTNACYGSGYTEFTLEHDARTAPVTDYSGESREFNFGVALIEHGKALTTERFITNPAASADRDLISQPGILKPELRGRPLDGAYRLRIYDSPALRWSRLEDIQIIVKYRYWSRIQTSGSFN